MAFGESSTFFAIGIRAQFDPSCQADVALIDLVHRLNEALIDNGRSSHNDAGGARERADWAPAYWRHWSPGYCIRPVE